jgi:hypothetical protein
MVATAAYSWRPSIAHYANTRPQFDRHCCRAFSKTCKCPFCFLMADTATLRFGLPLLLIHVTEFVSAGHEMFLLSVLEEMRS